MPNAGELWARIEFEKRVITLNTEGQSVITWVSDFTMRAKPLPSSATSMRFYMRYRKTNDCEEISAETHRILWKDQYWSIINSTHDRDDRSLMIDCDFSHKVEVSHLKSTEREWIDGLPTVNPLVE